MNNRSRLAAAALGVAFVFAIALGATGVLTPKNQRTALGASTTLAIISGDVQVRHGTGDYSPAEDGMVLAPGDSIRTGADARAVLTYFEGSTVEIEPGSELAIEVAHGNPDGSTVIEMRQQLGTTWHVVTHLVQGGSKYDVHTTASTASVRGTQFTVGVDANGTTTETTSEGAVANTDARNTTTVVTPPGQQTTTRQGQTPEPPKPAPEPLRKVTVTVGDTNTLVVDTLGRANGFTKDGKKVVQTPGATVQLVDGRLVVTLPGVPDGGISTHFQNTSNTADVAVTTRVEEKGKKAAEVTETVKPSVNSVTGSSIKKGSRASDDSAVDLKKTGHVKRPKVGGILPTPSTDAQDQAANTNNGTGTTSSTDPNNNGNGSGNTTTATSDLETRAKEADAEAKEEAAKHAEEDAKKAEQAKQAEDATKADEARKAADAARKTADDARKAAERAAADRAAADRAAAATAVADKAAADKAAPGKFIPDPLNLELPTLGGSGASGNGGNAGGNGRA